jgi:hypothetical protein
MKTRNVTDILTAIASVLTVLAALPYELGDVATIIPPSWKPHVALVGVIATVALRIIRPFLPSPNTPKPPTAPNTPT